MRTVSGKTLAAMRRLEPYGMELEVVFTWADVTHTVTMERIHSLKHTERMGDNKLVMEVDNTDGFFTRNSVNGYGCVASYGYDGDLYPTAPLRVVRVTRSSTPGKLRAEITAVGLFDMLAKEKARSQFTATKAAGYTVADYWGMLCEGTTLYKEAERETEYAVGEWSVIGDSGKALRCKATGTTAAEAPAVPDTSWGAEVTDGTATWSVEDEENPFGGTVLDVDLSNPLDYAVNTTDELFMHYVPSSEWTFDEGSSRKTALMSLLNLTNSVCRVDDDGRIVVFTPLSRGEGLHYEYGLYGKTPFYSFSKREDMPEPNRIVVRTPEEATTQYIGEAVDASFYYYPITGIYRAYVESDTEARELAEAYMAQLQAASTSSSASVPLHPGIELFDRVRLTDERGGTVEEGNVRYIQRRYGISDKDRSVIGFVIGFGERDRYRDALERDGLDENQLVYPSFSSGTSTGVSAGNGLGYRCEEGAVLGTVRRSTLFQSRKLWV